MARSGSFIIVEKKNQKEMAVGTPVVGSFGKRSIQDAEVVNIDSVQIFGLLLLQTLSAGSCVPIAAT